jgi:hypothetical protein
MEVDQWSIVGPELDELLRLIARETKASRTRCSLGRASAKFSPLGRNAPVRALTRADAKRLAGAPAPLRILVPVSIGA